MLTDQSRVGSQRGFTMIEALVAIVIFAVGILGLAGMQTASLRYQKAAWLRASTSVLASDIGERVRSNLAGAKETGSYQLTKSYADLIANPPSAPNIESGATPTKRQIADRDLAEWAAAAAEQLPGGAVNLAGDSAAGFVATLMWKDKTFSGTSPRCSSVGPSSQRNCCPLGAEPGIRCLRTHFVP